MERTPSSSAAAAPARSNMRRGPSILVHQYLSTTLRSWYDSISVPPFRSQYCNPTPARNSATPHSPFFECNGFQRFPTVSNGCLYQAEE
eukprot:880826-Rhodomonas_salina.1